MLSEVDYVSLMTRMTVPMHDCVRGFLLKHVGDITPDEQHIQQWVQDALDNRLDELSYEEREIIESRLLRTIRLRLASNGGFRDVH